MLPYERTDSVVLWLLSVIFQVQPIDIVYNRDLFIAINLLSKLRLYSAYLSVVLLWATTPIAIKWSAMGAGFVFGAALRMAIGLGCILLFLLLTRNRIPFHWRATQTYLAVALQIFGAMMAVYWSSRFIPSGWMSVIFGLTPFMTALLAAAVLKEKSLGTGKLLSYMLGITGLAMMFSSAIELSEKAIQGMLGVLLAAFLHSVSAVWVKQIHAGLSAMTQVCGGLLFAMPAYLLSWYLIEDAQWPQAIPTQSLLAIVYLGVIATSFGFAMYYFVLTHMAATNVAMITIISPVLALFLGYFVDDEIITAKVVVGTAMILSALLFHQFIDRRRNRKLRQRKPGY
jgi:drug/metabolite transporter (DMT)-like permease